MAEKTFRISFYLTLALSGLCLGYANYPFLSWMPLLILVFFGVLIVAYRVEGRWSLSHDAANLLGVVIALSMSIWILSNVPRSEKDLGHGLPWPAGLLPLLGPLLVILLLVKLFRPKFQSDFWSIQTIGLIMVILGCVLTGELVFGLILMVYLASGLWCLVAFYFFRGQFQEPADKVMLFSKPTVKVAGQGPPCTPGQVVRWTAYSVAFGSVLFIIAPRRSNVQWDILNFQAVTGDWIKVGGEGGIDLNRTGSILPSDEIAFHVEVWDRHGPRQTLAPDQRWRTEILDYYQEGRWFPCLDAPEKARKFATNKSVPPAHAILVSPPLGFLDGMVAPFLPGNPLWASLVHCAGNIPREPSLPLPPFFLQEGQLLVSFEVRPGQTGGLILAEPVIQGRGEGFFRHWVPDADRSWLLSRSRLFHSVYGSGTVVSIPRQLRRPQYFYDQILVTRPGRQIPAPEVRYDIYSQYLLGEKVPEAVGKLATELLKQLPSLRNLDHAGRVPQAHHAQVAKALERYLAGSGVFSYSLELRRRDPNADPTADFLLNVKRGHCERFAGALTLMLRSLGIPARVVKGYRGSESEGNGRFVIRQNLAHSWVEALVPGKQPGTYDWLLLDPTPESSPEALTWMGWMAAQWHESRIWWKEHILDYGSEKQTEVVQDILESLVQPNHLHTVNIVLPRTLPWIGLVLGLGLLGFLAGRLGKFRIRSRVASSSEIRFFQRLLAILGRHCNLRPRPGQTPREFSTLAQTYLAKVPAAQDLADLPLQVASAYYLTRFGNQPLSEAEQQILDRKISDLELSLKIHR